MKNLIIDCYTDEPSGLGVPPYLSVHSRYLAGALKYVGQEYEYINIDDLRLFNGESLEFENSLNKRTVNYNYPTAEIKKFLEECNTIFVVMGCFVDYNYLSCEPPTFNEIEKLLSNYKTKNIVLMYALGSKIVTREELDNTLPKNLFNKVVLEISIIIYFMVMKLIICHIMIF